MSNKLVITNMNYKEQPVLVTALFENDKLEEIFCENLLHKNRLHNIYIGRVENIVSNIQAAFVEIEKGFKCYYSLIDNPNPVFTKKNGKQPLNIGDELIVQVSKEALKTKAPVVSSNLNLNGKYFVLTTGITKIGFSKKINKTDKKKLNEIIETFDRAGFGMVVRTNAKDVSYSELKTEWDSLVKQCKDILSKAPYRPIYSELYQGNPKYLEHLNSSYGNQIQEIITDDITILDQVQEYLALTHQDITLKKYEDNLLPLYKLYSIEKHITDAIKEKIWLKSGAYIIIQPTEAFVAIDINTGKFVGKKKIQETFLKINIEAAKEIARQLRLRNLSGICIIDFIDLDSETDKQMLMQEFQKFLSKDPVPVVLVGMTKLNLVELTRKKISKSIYEQITSSCHLCSGKGYL